MKLFTAFIATFFTISVFACEAHAQAAKVETNCVTKDKKGNCPPPPKGEKPTPKKVEKKEEAKK